MTTPPPVFDDVWSAAIWLVVSASVIALVAVGRVVVSRLSTIDRRIGRPPGPPDDQGPSVAEMASISVTQGEQILAGLSMLRRLIDLASDRIDALDALTGHNAALIETNRVAIERVEAELHAHLAACGVIE